MKLVYWLVKQGKCSSSANIFMRVPSPTNVTANWQLAVFAIRLEFLWLHLNNVYKQIHRDSNYKYKTDTTAALKNSYEQALRIVSCWYFYEDGNLLYFVGLHCFLKVRLVQYSHKYIMNFCTVTNIWKKLTTEKSPPFIKYQLHQALVTFSHINTRVKVGNIDKLINEIATTRLLLQAPPHYGLRG